MLVETWLESKVLHNQEAEEPGGDPGSCTSCRREIREETSGILAQLQVSVDSSMGSSSLHFIF